ncbi:MAG: site-2 protease family protein [Nitrospinae bacterium]|nr:site-2 protease family protein [Nitrospinota bacterium]
MAIPVVFAVTLHEVAHGYVAHLKGDDTAKILGRLTLNPIAHIDIFGTVILPILFYTMTGFLFAYAKPVPVNFQNLANPKRDMAIVAVAGPVTNVILAILSSLALNGIGMLSPGSLGLFHANLAGNSAASPGVLILPLMYMFYFSIVLNTILAIINLIPIPPADGGRIVVGLLPEPASSSYASIESYGMLILVFILFMNPLNIIDYTVRPLITGILNLLI